MPAIVTHKGNCVLKDVRGPGVGPDVISTAYGIRTLNTFEGDTWFCTLSGNQFTLIPGKYQIRAVAPFYGYRPGYISKSRLWNVTTGGVQTLSTGQIISSESGTDGAVLIGICVLTAIVTIPVNYTFRLEQRVTGGATQGGHVIGGDNEIYSQVGITKIT